MLHVYESIFDANGEMLSRDAIIGLHTDRDTASIFVQQHLEKSFAGGKCGYNEADDYWWGCDTQPTFQIYRYTIEPTDSPAP